MVHNSTMKLADSLQPANGFDLFRLSRSKAVVDVCPNTLRAYFKAGLPYYRMGKAIFVSRSQLQAFIVTQANRPQPAA